MLTLVIGKICGFLDQPDGMGEGGFEEGRRWGRISTGVGPFWVAAKGRIEVELGIRSLSGLAGVDRGIG